MSKQEKRNPPGVAKPAPKKASAVKKAKGSDNAEPTRLPTPQRIEEGLKKAL